MKIFLLLSLILVSPLTFSSGSYGGDDSNSQLLNEAFEQELEEAQDEALNEELARSEQQQEEEQKKKKKLKASL